MLTINILPTLPTRPPHWQATERLQSAIRSMHSLVSDLRGACEEVGLGAARAKREVDASRAAVKAALRWGSSWRLVTLRRWADPSASELLFRCPLGGWLTELQCSKGLTGCPCTAPVRLCRAHREACEAFEQRQRPAGRADPWLTEGCLVEQQVRLQRSQHVERQYLAAAFRRVGDLEQRRATVVQAALQTFVAIYRAQVVPIQEIAGGFR